MSDIKEEPVVGEEVEVTKNTSEDGNQETTSAMETLPPKEKKVRRRKKAIFQAVRQQMEFYFSDANLAKDRFMQKVANENDEVDLEIFMKFNKIRSLCENVKEVAAALRQSTFLKLNETETKVSRIVPFMPKPQTEIDNCTIYVEQIPPSGNIEWVKSIFSEFGPVAYVSLPRYRDQSRNKGFAFVEFCDEESAVKAVQAYATTSCYLTLEDDPGKLLSIRAFNTESGQDQESQNLETKTDVTDEEKQDDEKENDETEPRAKKRKVEASESVSETPKMEEDEQRQTARATEKKSKKKRKRRQSYAEENIVREAATLSLQVMSKKDWKRLRNKYLDLQRKYRKQVAISKRNQQAEIHRRNHNADQEVFESPKAQEAVEVKLDSVSVDQMPSGVIVKIVLEEPISDAKRFKSQVRSRPEVQYVEAEACQQVAYVRCKDAEAAQHLVDQNIWTGSEILKGDEEREYWQKIEEGRLKKRQMQIRQRNRKAADSNKEGPALRTQEVQNHAHGQNRHIRFDESEDV